MGHWLVGAPKRRHVAHAVCLALLCLVTVATPGCTRYRNAPGRLESRSLSGDPVVLESDYSIAHYRLETDGIAAFVLSDVPLESLLDGSVQRGQVLHVELLWTPRAGQTPMDAAATNATIRHVVISDGEVGVYVGAGFARPRKAPGVPSLTVSLEDGTVRLGESTERFRDPLSPARLTGTYTASLDADATRRLERALSQFVTNAFGASRVVGN